MRTNVANSATAHLRECTEQALSVLRLARDGKSNLEIADEVGQSERAVGIIVGKFMRAIGATSRRAAVDQLKQSLQEIGDDHDGHERTEACSKGNGIEASGDSTASVSDADRPCISDEASGVDPAAPALGERLRKLIGEGFVTVAELARQTHLSEVTIYTVSRGRKSAPSTVRLIELAIGQIEQRSKGIPAKLLDQTLRELAQRVCAAAQGANELDELVRLVFLRWQEVKGLEKSAAFAFGILCRYVAVEDPQKRLDALLDLHSEMMKLNK